MFQSSGCFSALLATELEFWFLVPLTVFSLRLQGGEDRRIVFTLAAETGKWLGKAHLKVPLAVGRGTTMVVYVDPWEHSSWQMGQAHVTR